MSSGPDLRVEEDRRLRAVTALAGAAYLLLAVRLFDLQIVQGAEMLRQAEQNRTQLIPLSAPRGRIRDRNGEILVDNAPRFSLFYSNLSIQKEESERIEAQLAALFPERALLLQRHLEEARQTGKMTRLLAGLPREKALGLIERRVTLPGVQVVVEPQRWARFGELACHVLGYVDEINPQELKNQKDEKARSGQFVGRMGVEKMYDALIRGVDGGIQFEMDARGRHLQVLRRIPAQTGNDVVLTLDHALQAAAEKGLEETVTGRGAVVALDPRTGAVLALVSRPGFDPSGDLNDALSDPDLPLFNRALQGTYPPGSVFKAITAAGALRGGWDVKKTFYCTGVFRLGAKEFKCWKRHNLMDFVDALVWSCDFYYYNMGRQVGVAVLEELGKGFGLGEKSGIDLTSEASGVLPGVEWKRRVMKQAWFEGDTINMSIGQGFTTVTPLQAALLIAAVANEGTLWRPQVVDRVLSPDGTQLYKAAPQVRRRVELSPEVWETLKHGLQEVVHRGTGGGAYRADLVIGGKTGTAQNPHGQDHAWFAAYAGKPDEPPSLAVVAFVENGGHGSDAALPVVREILKEAFPTPAPAVPAAPAAAPGGTHG